MTGRTSDAGRSAGHPVWEAAGRRLCSSGNLSNRPLSGQGWPGVVISERVCLQALGVWRPRLGLWEEGEALSGCGKRLSLLGCCMIFTTPVRRGHAHTHFHS